MSGGQRYWRRDQFTVGVFALLVLFCSHAYASPYWYNLESLGSVIDSSDIAVVAYCVSVTPNPPTESDEEDTDYEDQMRAYMQSHQIKLIEKNQTDNDSTTASTNTSDEPDDEEHQLSGQPDFEEWPPKDIVRGTVKLEVRWVAKGPASVRLSQSIIVRDELLAQPGQLYLVLGKNHLHGTDWTVERPMSQAYLEYAQNAPDRVAFPPIRHLYFFDYLESPNKQISADAVHELGQYVMEPDEIEELAKKLPLEKIRQRLTSIKPSKDTYWLYSQLIRHVGDDSDARFYVEYMWTHPWESDLDSTCLVRDIRFRQEAGMAALDGHLMDQGALTDAQKRACLAALTELGEKPPAGVPRARIVQSLFLVMRDRRFFVRGVDTATKWREWSVQDQLVAELKRQGWRVKTIRKPVVKYLVTCALDLRSLTSNPPQAPVHALKALQHLDALQQRDVRVNTVIWEALFAARR